MPRILVVDDDDESCRFLADLLAAPGRTIETESDPTAALDRAREQPFDLVVSDLQLGGHISGLDVLRAYRDAQPGGRVVLVTAFGTLDAALEAERVGASSFISKPFDIDQVRTIVERALDNRPADGGPEPKAAGGSKEPPAPAELLGRTGPMLAVYSQIAKAADSTAPVLIIGESGTGKELVARALHGKSQRASQPFVGVSCGALTESLLETELFGHVRGAFTGAVVDKKGLFEQAGRGTVFLDEVGETSPALQVRLLRVLEEGEVRPVGGQRSVPVHARVVTATNRELDRLDKAAGAPNFRDDLYYRLSVILITLPPLRQRRDDIPLLADAFLAAACRREGKTKTLTPSVVDVLTAYDWPGNVRQLKHSIDRLVVLSGHAVIEVQDLPESIRQAHPSDPEALFAGLPTLAEIERRYLLHVLKAVQGTRAHAARVMGIDRRTLYRMAARHGITLDDLDE